MLIKQAWLLCLAVPLFCTSAAQQKIKYSTPAIPWEASLGNHRAVMEVPRSSPAVRLNLEWRRHDRNVDERRFIIVRADSQDTIANIYRVRVNSNRCELVFGPAKQGKYYFYYLPYQAQPGEGYFNTDYLSKEAKPDDIWVNENRIGNNGTYWQLPEATLLGIESRTGFDSFFPMEVVANDAEKTKLRRKATGNFMLFAEDRKFPIRMLDDIPSRWAERFPSDKFSGEACRNEYYTFQVGLWALKDVDAVKVRFSALKGNKYVLPASAFTCFNTEGTDAFGKPFTKSLHVKQTGVQPLWIGVDLPGNIPPGVYTGSLTVTAANAERQEIAIRITVNNRLLTDRGDAETWRHSRLRWLNSTAGIDEKNVAPYRPVSVLEKGGINLTGKQILFDASGMPASIKVYGEEMLAAPVRLSVFADDDEVLFEKAGKPERINQADGIVSDRYCQASKQLKLATRSDIESDGWMKYTFEIEALENINLTDVRLNIPYRKEASRYIMGMGLAGTETPFSRDARWGGPYTSFLAKETPGGVLRFDNGADLNYGPFDAFWLGSEHAGLHCELRGASYTGPMLREFNPGPPPSWDNQGKGGFRIRTEEKQVNATAYTGERALHKGEKIVLECAFLITPVKPLDTHSQFTARYFQRTPDPVPGEEALKAGVTVVNIHHANKYNPYINYPYIAVGEMKKLVDTLHSDGVKVKIYNSVTGLSDYATEIWALRSLGDEIMRGGESKGYVWLREHYIENYKTLWYQPLANGEVDASVFIDARPSRWYNYYVEGLKWLVKNVGIDGIYLDDVSYGRDMIKRIRKAVAQDKPDFLMDLHSHRWFSGGPALQYAELFPYLNKLWFGEEFKYNQMPPANWMVETSGIPFGLMGDMLEDGGNIWRGMLYGMSSRLGWSGDPTAVWKLWDDFGIADAKMIGYWESKPPVTTSDKAVLATVYTKDKKALISIASWAAAPVSVTLNIDFKQLGIDSGKVKIVAPEMKGVQAGRSFSKGEAITVEPAKGWLLVIE